MIYDFVGVGFGPSNIALAVMAEEYGYTGNYLFLEKQDRSYWHKSMLLNGSDIQNNPLRDIVTPVNPRSKYTFVNYMHQSGRFFDYLNLPSHFPLRRDFAKYVEWVASHFSNVEYSTPVLGVEKYIGDNGETLWKLMLSDGRYVVTKCVVWGTGRKLNIPDIPGEFDNTKVVHLTQYLDAIFDLPKNSSVAVLGASQSAVEILLDLAGRDVVDIHSVYRSYSIRLKDTSPFSDEVYFPEYTDYYHGLNHENRTLLDKQTRQTNYSSCDGDILNELYVKIYEDKLRGGCRFNMHRNTEIESIESEGGKIRLLLNEKYLNEKKSINVDLLVLATGFLDVGRSGREGLPDLLKPHSSSFHWQGSNLQVNRDYRVESSDESAPLYLNGLCESSHGLGDAGSFSLVSIRARDILSSIWGVDLCQ